MAKKFLTGLNLVVLDTDPDTGSEGELYFNSSASVAKIYQAGSWSVLGAGGGGTTVSTTEPSSPEIGDSWYKNDTGEFYIYDGTYWVEVNGVIASESFKTISVSGQSDVVADSNTDTLTLVAGTNVSITTNATNDSITINADSKSTSSVYLVRNNTGSTILKGTLVSASGAEPSGRIDVEPFAAVGGINSEITVMGMATANISNGVNGEVISFGTLTGLDTRGNTVSAIAVGDETWAEGDILFAHPTVAGKLTKIRPQHDLAVAFITVRHASTGQIAVRIVPGNNHLEWMHDVLISGSVQNNEILAYDLSSNLWINQTAEEAGLLTISSASTTYAPIINPVFTNDIQVDGQINLLMSGSVATSYISSFYDIFAEGPSTKLLGRHVQVETDTVGDQFSALYLQPGIASLTASGESSYVTLSGASGQYLNSFDPSNQIATIGNISASISSHNHTLDSLSNVDINSLNDGDAIIWSSASSAWINQVASGGGGSQFTNSSELASLISDETGSGSLVFSNSPSLVTPDIGAATASSLVVGDATIKTTTTVMTSASATTIATFPASSALSAECLVVFSSEDSGAQTTSKVLIAGDDGNGTVDITEYAIIQRDGGFGIIDSTISASLSGGNILLRATVSNYEAVTAKVVSTHILSPLGAS
jgi:hypothetical protein